MRSYAMVASELAERSGIYTEPAVTLVEQFKWSSGASSICYERWESIIIRA